MLESFGGRASVARLAQRARPLELGFGRLGRLGVLLHDRPPELDRSRIMTVGVESGCGGKHECRSIGDRGGGLSNAAAAAAVSARASARNACPTCAAESSLV